MGRPNESMANFYPPLLATNDKKKGGKKREGEKKEGRKEEEERK